MLMTFRDKKILRLLIKMSENHIRPIDYKELVSQSSKIGFDEEELLTCLADLHFSELIVPRVPSFTHKPIDLELTYLGLRYLVYKRKLFYQFLVRSFFLPIVVSLVITLITIWATNLFK